MSAQAYVRPLSSGRLSVAVFEPGVSWQSMTLTEEAARALLEALETLNSGK
jgi:hypothetical protein